jgi:hypothetical protein
MDFWAAARPRAQTTNQTLRMLGLYEGEGHGGSTLLAFLSLPGDALSDMEGVCLAVQ